MTAYVRDTTTIGPSLIYASVAINDSVTFLQGLTFFNTDGTAVEITHGNNTVYNTGSIMSGATDGLGVYNANDCEVINTATGTIASLSSVDGYSAIQLYGDRNALQNAGEVYSVNGTGVYQLGIGSVIDNSGRIQGRDYGVLAAGVDYTILNSGTIESLGGVFSAAVYLSGSGNSKSLVNTGVIQSLTAAGRFAVWVVGDGLTTIDNAGTIRCVSGVAIDGNNITGTIHLTNSGTIASSTLGTYSVVGTGQADVIINTGTINRGVALANGNDLFDGIGGFVGGTVHGGYGNDVFRISDPLAQVFEDAGQGLLDRIESTVSFSLAATGELEQLTLLGTATNGTGNGLANLINGNDMNNVLRGGGGEDTVYGGVGNDSVFGDVASDKLYGDDGDDSLRGGVSSDKLYGGTGDDTLRGDGSNDNLFGDDGEDVLIGGTGRDLLSGGLDADTFRFRPAPDSLPGATFRDQITDFEAGIDTIDLTSVDANALLTGNQTFTWIGTGAFGSVAGQLRLLAGPNSLLQGDVNGDGVADFEVQFNGIATLSVNDILL